MTINTVRSEMIVPKVYCLKDMGGAYISTDLFTINYSNQKSVYTCDLGWWLATAGPVPPLSGASLLHRIHTLVVISNKKVKPTLILTAKQIMLKAADLAENMDIMAKYGIISLHSCSKFWNNKLICFEIVFVFMMIIIGLLNFTTINS